jgi:lipopolysaccharide O-acetyltransferase
MNKLEQLVRQDGWMLGLGRAARSMLWRRRDAHLARRLRAPGFRAGRSPKLSGLRHMTIGRNFHAADGLWLEAVVTYGGQQFVPELVIGEEARLSDRVHIACVRRVEIGSGLLAGSGVLISDHTHGSYRGVDQSDPSVPPSERPLSSGGEVVIGRNVWLGERVAVLAGSRIGDGAVIGANSVVTGTIPAETIAVGAPARPVRQWDRRQRAWLPIESDAGRA